MDHVRAVCAHLDLAGIHADVALVTFAAPARAAEYRTEHLTSVPVLVDHDRTAYRAYGLGRGRLGTVWGPESLRRYVEIVRRDGIGRLRRPTEDTRQLGGDFVIAPDGTLAWGHWGTGPADRPDPSVIARAIATCNGV